MKLKYLPLLTVLILFSLTACTKQEPTGEDTTPTLPTFATHKTPWELLNEAIDNTKAAASCTVRYGTVEKQGDTTTENIHSQTVTSEHPFDTDTLYQDVPSFPANEDFIADFCAMPLRVIPSNDGTFRYELPELTWDALWALMHGPSNPDDRYGDYTQILCTAAIDIDPQGRISRLEFITELFSEAQQPERTVTVFLSADYGA